MFVLETKVVVRGLPFQLTTEEGKKLAPLSETLNEAPPAIAELGVMRVMVGGGG